MCDEVLPDQDVRKTQEAAVLPLHPISTVTFLQMRQPCVQKPNDGRFLPPCSLQSSCPSLLRDIPAVGGVRALTGSDLPAARVLLNLTFLANPGDLFLFLPVLFLAK